MTSEEIFYCDIPVFNNHPAIKLKCYAQQCDDKTMFANGYYEFSVDKDEYLKYYNSCKIKTKDEEDEWLGDLYFAIADGIANKFNIDVSDFIADEQGYWDVNYSPKMVFSYVYYAYDDF